MKNKSVIFAFLGGIGLLHFSLTAVAQPVAVTLAATSIGPTNATVNGTVNPNGALAAGYYQYGLTTNYGNIGGFVGLPAVNTAQTLPGLVVNALHGPAGTNWIQTSAPINNWYSIASSADGTHQAAVIYGGGIYTSGNSGGTWVGQSDAPSTNWFSIASSADGSFLAAVVAGGGVYTSTNTGVTWTLTSAPATNWVSIASSADGTHLAAVVYGGGIYTSTNGGGAWALTSAPSRNWSSIASSAEGTRLAAAVNTGDGIYTSTDGGITWRQATAINAHWLSIACSADGTRLAAVDGLDAKVWTSSDGGSGWTLTSAPTGLWRSIASSADGSRLAVASYYNPGLIIPGNGVILTSTDGGVTWAQTSAPAQNWYSVASSADGSQLAAVNYGGGIVTSIGPANNLTPGTTCHYRAVGLNSAGTGLGSDLTFTTPAAAPTVTTLPASGVTSSNATLNGTVNPNAAATATYFQYGLTTNYGSYSATNAFIATNITLALSNIAANLTPGATYHFQLIAGNSVGTNAGADLTFTTPQRLPTVTTLAASGVGSTSATLNGTVNPNGAATFAYFQYGLTTNYDNLGGFTPLPATNTDQTLPGLMISALHGPAGANWTLTSAPATNWTSIASSADGTRLAAVVYGGGIYTSTNNGGTWTQTSAPSTNWESIASSADGTRLAAVVYGDGIYTSTDSGASWVPGAAPATNWLSIASSADGWQLAAVVYGGGIYVSTNGGGNWTLTSAPSRNWSSIASSADGARLAAAVNTGDGIYTSTDGGITWRQATALNAHWLSIASSADGTHLAAVDGLDAKVWTSADGGSGWTLTSAPIGTWQSIASSADGSRLALAAFYNPSFVHVIPTGVILTSTDGGVTWAQSSAPAQNWYSIASSADGSQLAAVAAGGRISTSVGPATNLTPGTTCHYRAVGLNSAGTGLGSDLTFTTPATTPTVTTLPASGVTSSNATLNGTVNPNAAATAAYFQYGLTTSYGSYSTTNAFAATNITLALSNIAANLTPGATYHFQLVASNSVGANAGADLTFTVVPLVPTATTLAASGVGSTSATLNGTVNPNGAATFAYFQYGLTTDYDNESAFVSLPATNTTLNLPGLVVTALSGPAGTNWTVTSAPSTNWITIACSADGIRLVAGVGGGGIYTSTNGGGTWTLTSAPVQNWNSIASSDDGMRLAAAVNGGSVYTSTNGGSTWVQTSASATGWDSIACSADGMRLALALYNGTIWTSTNAGSTWTKTSLPTANWYSIASSADGMRLAAVGQNLGSIFTSTNGGATWSSASVPVGFWDKVISSADGTRLAASMFNGGVYTSTNGGSTWTPTSLPVTGWNGLACSANGTRLTAAIANGGIYASTDGGVTWTLANAPATTWDCIASSADGTKLAGVAYAGGRIYTSTGISNNLTYGTTYHFRLVGYNSAGTSLGNDLSFTTSPGAPIATTLPATSVTSSDATLNGMVNPKGAATSAYFQYGLTTNYGSYSATNAFAATNITLALSNIAANLTPGTTYHFQLVASNSLGGNVGGDLTLTTLAQPAVATLAATDVTPTNATLNGTVNPNRAITSAYFRYGLTTGYGSYSATNLLAGTNIVLSVSNLIASLTTGATYHFQLVAGNSVGTNAGADLTFTTPQRLPTVTTLAASGVGSTNATLNGTVNPNGYAAYAYFQYGLTTNYDSESVIASLPATNAALNVPGLVVTALSGPAGTNWTVTSAPSTNWSTIASSADGTRLAAVVSGGGIYTSTNGGGTWTPTSAPVQNWSSIASSDDGMRLAAAVNGGSVYTSTNGGSTWVQTGASATGWDSIACSADGMRLALALYNGTIWTSTNAGSTWTQTSLPATNWYSIASSADGMRLAAVGQNLGSIYTSTDGGASWNSTSVPVGFWDKVISSADGTRLAASMLNGDVYTSTDGGNTWTQTSLPIGAWNGLACSANGMRLAAAIVNVGIYASTDGGVTWTFANAPATTWGCIVSSADGTKLAAVAYGGGGRIYTSTGSLNNLTPDTTYHFRVVGYNSAGTSLGDDLTFTTSLGAPTATTLPASSVTATNATLNGSVLTSDLDTSVYFLYGSTTNYNRRSATNTLAATNITLYVSNLVSLIPLRTYHFQLVASNSLGTTLGGDLTLTTPPLVPAVTTSAATSIGRTNATLHGTVNPNGAVSTAYFQYGLTTNYGSYSPTNTLGASNINLSVSNLLSSLAPGTTYHFQLVAGNSGGTGVGNDLTFATVAGPPTPTTLPASDVTGTNATLNGSLLTGHLATAAYFQYGLTTNYGSYSATNTLASAFVTLSVSNLVSNLAPNKTYHFRLVATNSTGSALGNDLSVVTAMLPAVMTLPATSITASNAALNGTVNPENLLGAAYFQYGLTTNYDNLGGFVALPATNTAQTLPSLMVNALHGPAGANWTNTPAPSASWFSIASSADGTRLAAVVKASGASGGIYTSTNSGVTWTLTSAPITWNTNGSAAFWFSIASSADGMRLAAVLYQGGIYTSTDGGVTWTQSGAPTADYVSIASSADGTRLAAAASPAFAGGIYTSTNGGVTWTQTAAPSAYYRAIACSADGTRLAAVMGGVLGQGIYVSTNAGVTWTQTDASYRYNAVACSADGMRVTVAGDRGVVFISNDGGFSWGYHQPYPVNWNSVASSADGIRLAIAAGNLGIRTSTDGGYTWSGGAELNVTWQGLASSADGSQLAAAAFGGSTGTSSPLTMGTTYHYRAVGLNGAGTGLGNDLTFTIPAAAPTAVTMAATSVTSSNATLNGTINPNGAVTTVYFRYGLTTNYGNYSTTNTLAATNVTLSVTNLISSLTPGTTYHFELVAGNSAGTNAGADMLFTTLASAVSFNLNGEVVLPGGAFQFGFTNTSGLGFTVLTTTNLSLPLTNWTVLGAPVEGPPGHYQFTDPQATNSPTRFYRVRSP